MKRFLLWVVGVILGVAVLLGAVMTVSYSFTGEGSRPAADTQFGGQALEVNGSCWQACSIRCSPAPKRSPCRNWACCMTHTRPSPCPIGPATPP